MTAAKMIFFSHSHIQSTCVGVHTFWRCAFRGCFLEFVERVAVVGSHHPHTPIFSGVPCNAATVKSLLFVDGSPREREAPHQGSAYRQPPQYARSVLVFMVLTKGLFTAGTPLRLGCRSVVARRVCCWMSDVYMGSLVYSSGVWWSCLVLSSSLRLEVRDGSVITRFFLGGGCCDRPAIGGERARSSLLRVRSGHFTLAPWLSK